MKNLLAKIARRAIASIVTAVLLSVALPSIAMGQYNPAAFDNALLYLPNDPTKMWEGAVNGSDNPSNGDTIQNVEMGIAGRVWFQNTLSSRPFFNDGDIQFGPHAATNRLLRFDTVAATKVIHESGVGKGMVRVRLAEVVAAVRVVIDNTNLNTTGIGWRVSLLSTGAVNLRMNNGASAILDISTTALIDDLVEHTIKWNFATGAGASWIELDGARVTGTRGTVGTGDGQPTFLATRNTGANPFQGWLSELWVGTGPPSAAQEAMWDAGEAPAAGGGSSRGGQRKGSRIGPAISIGSNASPRKLIAVPDEFTIAP